MRFETFELFFFASNHPTHICQAALFPPHSVASVPPPPQVALDAVGADDWARGPQRTDKYDKFKPKRLSAETVASLKRDRGPEEGWEEARAEARASRSGGKAAGGGGLGDLTALIRAKQASRADAFDAMTAALEAKYGGSDGKAAGGKGKGKGKAGK